MAKTTELYPSPDPTGWSDPWEAQSDDTFYPVRQDPLRRLSWHCVTPWRHGSWTLWPLQLSE